MVENKTYGKEVKRKSLLSEEVQEILKSDKLDFAELVEAVRKDKLPSDQLEDEENDSFINFNYEQVGPTLGSNSKLHDTS